jgi:lysozyme family protein
MGERQRLNQLRLVFAFVLAIGLSGTAAATVSSGGEANRSVTARSPLNVAATATQAATLRAAATTVRHAIAKRHLPATAGALVVLAVSLVGLTRFVVRRRRTNASLHRHALSHGARAPPAFSQI